MNRLLNIGFKKTGYWYLENDCIKFQLDIMQNSKNILYAFICDGEVKYIGKSTRTLKQRMNGYQHPGPTQRTNILKNRNILNLLKEKKAVDIFVLPDNGLLHYGTFHVNLAAGLEDDLIRQINPEWNYSSYKKRKETQFEVQEKSADKNLKTDHFIEDYEGLKFGKIVLQTTYYQKGFFNLPVKLDKFVGEDKEEIEIQYGDPIQFTTGYINRTANLNKTPRIMGGKDLRDWFQECCKPGATIKILFLSKNQIRLEETT
jgi:hypothetical protein